MPSMKKNNVDKLRTKALCVVTEALSHFDADMPETPYSETVDLGTVASQIVEKLAADLSDMLHILNIWLLKASQTWNCGGLHVMHITV